MTGKKTISNRGLRLIKSFEGFRRNAYQDGGGVWTIGYGHTSTAKPGMKVTRKEATKLLEQDIQWAEDAVNRLTHVHLKQCQFDALVSFVFNLGATAFKNSTLLQVVNKQQHNLVPEQLCRWVYDNGETVKGLARRRVAESKLYLKE